MDAIDKAATKLLNLLGNTGTKRVGATLGAEQEYFLIDKKFIDKRLDLLLTGRTLFGAPSPKGQEKDDHYFGSLHERVATFMNDLNKALWKLGVSATTQHNEVSPAQYELAPIFASVNVATDHNQLIMETMQKIALRHDFVCLLHEKPFAGVNGSGKHNNWSLSTDDGINLLDPGSTPHDNLIFLMVLCSTIKAVDKYSALLRASVANPGNAHRLGANEAPPAIISIFLGEQLNEIFEQLQAGGATSSRQSGMLELGVTTLPPLPKDNTDRNRTSPFAFTGNKFEFRMVGSTTSTSGPMFVLNTIVADVMNEVCAELEKADNKEEKAKEIIKKFATEHKRVVFNGDNYSDDWVKEAEKRGLPNLASTLEALKVITEDENIAVFERNKVLSAGELHARQEILLENYCLTLSIEAKTMINIAKNSILPAVISYTGDVANSVSAIKGAGADASAAAESLSALCSLTSELKKGISNLEEKFGKASGAGDLVKEAQLIESDVIPAMDELRSAADCLETLVDKDKWPLPSYAEMLFVK
jgi:glutamine synthetase